MPNPRFPTRAVLSALIVGALAVGSQPARADDPAPTSIALSQVLEVSVRQNRSLALASIDVDIADAAVLEAAGIDDWLLVGTGSLTLLRAPFQGKTTTTTSVDMGGSLSRSLSSGGTLSLSAGGAWTDNPFSLTSDYRTSVSASLTQPLLRDRGRTIARANQIQATINRDAATLSREARAIVVIRDVITGYWELAYSIRDLEIRRGSLELASERLRITKAGIDAGAVAPTEALAVKQVIATREGDILSAEVNVSVRSLELRQLAGLEIGPNDIDLTTAAPLEVKPIRFDLAELLDRAFQNSPEIAALAAREKGATLDVQVTENGTLSRLDATVGAGPTGVAENPATATRLMATFDGVSVSANFRYEQSLGHRAASGRFRRSRSNLLAARINLRDSKAQIASAIVRAVKLARSAEKRMEISKRAITLAEQNIDAEKARFDLGRATNFDIAQRQEELKLAQLRYARAAVDYLEAVVLVDALTGDILGKYGIKLDDK